MDRAVSYRAWLSYCFSYVDGVTLDIVVLQDISLKEQSGVARYACDDPLERPSAGGEQPELAQLYRKVYCESPQTIRTRDGIAGENREVGILSLQNMVLYFCCKQCIKAC